jgi:hypothetical protein
MRFINYYLILAFLFLSGCQMPPQPGDYRHNEDTLSVVSIRYALSVGNAGSETVEIPGDKYVLRQGGK